MIRLPIINAFISAGAFKTQSVLCRIIKDERLEVHVWSNAEKCLIPRPPGPIFQDIFGFMSSSESVPFRAFPTPSIAGTDSTHTEMEGRACGNPRLQLEIREGGGMSCNEQK